MYQVNSKKKYDVKIMQEGQYLNTTVQKQNVTLLAVERDFVALMDEEGKEHIYTGAIGIYISES